jgi:hypothetical protein
VPVLHVACVRLHAIAPTHCELFRRRAGRMRTRSGALSPIPIPAADSRIQDGPSCASRRVGHETRSHADLRDRDRDESSARHKAPGCARIRRPVSARSSAKASYDVVSPKRPKTGGAKADPSTMWTPDTCPDFGTRTGRRRRHWNVPCILRCQAAVEGEFPKTTARSGVL